MATAPASSIRPSTRPTALDLSPAFASAQPGIADYESFIGHPSVLSYITRYVKRRTGSTSRDETMNRGWSALSATDCDDILQDIRVTIWRNWSKLDGRSLNSQIAYAMRVARSRISDRYRDRRRRREIVASALDAESASASQGVSNGVGVESDLLSVILSNAPNVNERTPTLAQSARLATVDPETLLVERERLHDLIGRMLSVCATPQHRLILLCYVADYSVAETLIILAAASYATTERTVYCTRSRLVQKVRCILAGESSSRVEQLALLA